MYIYIYICICIYIYIYYYYKVSVLHIIRITWGSPPGAGGSPSGPRARLQIEGLIC